MSKILLNTYKVVDAIKFGARYPLPFDLDGRIGLPLPKDCFTGLYGRSGMTNTADMHDFCRKTNQELLMFDVEIEAGSRLKDRVELDVTKDEREDSGFLSSLSEVKVLDFRRGRMRLWNDVETLWRQYLDRYPSEGVDPSVALAEGFPRKYTTRPDLLSKLIREPRYSHLDAIIYQVKSESGDILSLCTVFNRDIITKVTCLNSPTSEVTIRQIRP